MSTRKRPPAGEEFLLTVGDTRYERIMELLPGPHGERVFVARRRAPGVPPERVILKMLALPAERPIPDFMERSRRRLEEEVRLARYLQHPGIAQVHGLHERSDALVVELEHVPGVSVDEAFCVALTAAHRYSERFLLHVAAQVASTLAYAHSRRDEQGLPLSIVHRDLQPERLRITPRGAVRLMDFGIAWSLLPGRLPTSVTRPQGQALYAAPEVLLQGPVDGRADLFSLGLVLLELGTGLHLYDLPYVKDWELEERLGAEDRRRVVRASFAAWEVGLPAEDYQRAALHAAAFEPEDVERLSERLPPSLRAILRRLLRGDPDARYPSAQALERDLRERLDAVGGSSDAEAMAELEHARREAGARLVREAEGTPSSPH
jgi:serine/threonine-protein kinase